MQWVRASERKRVGTVHVRINSISHSHAPLDDDDDEFMQIERDHEKFQFSFCEVKQQQQRQPTLYQAHTDERIIINGTRKNDIKKPHSFTTFSFASRMMNSVCVCVRAVGWCLGFTVAFSQARKCSKDIHTHGFVLMVHDDDDDDDFFS
jgi:hypothetical protein